MATTPPSGEALTRALVRFDYRCSLPVAAAFLASPTTAVPGIDAGADDQRMWIGGHTADHDSGHGASVRHIAETAAALAARTAHAGGQYLDLDASPQTWLKVVRSGWREVVFGPDLLWGAPRVALEGPLGAVEAATFIAAWRADPALTYPTFLTTPAGAPVFVDGTRRRVLLSGRDAGAVPAPEGPCVPALTAAEDIAARLGGQVRRVSQSPVDLAWSVTVTVPGLEQLPVMVRFTVHGGSYQLTRSALQVLQVTQEPCDDSLPAGFTWAHAGPLRCLVHKASGVVTEPTPAAGLPL